MRGCSVPRQVKYYCGTLFVQRVTLLQYLIRNNGFYKWHLMHTSVGKHAGEERVRIRRSRVKRARRFAPVGESLVKIRTPLKSSFTQILLASHIYGGVVNPLPLMGILKVPSASRSKQVVKTGNAMTSRSNDIITETCSLAGRLLRQYSVPSATFDRGVLILLSTHARNSVCDVDRYPVITNPHCRMGF